MTLRSLYKSLTFHMVLLMGLAICTGSCEHLNQLPDPDVPAGQDKVKTFYGPATPLGKGVARAWVSLNRQGEPLSVGVKVSERAIESLMKEAEKNHEREEEHEEHQSFVLELPKQAESTLYDHFTLDWNPHGHPAPGIYDLPHFDVHAYMISEEEKVAIVPLAPFGENGEPQFDESPAPEFMPQDYFLEPGIVPAMGAHLLDEIAPEFHGETFTQTFIYGSYKGEIIFHEPMVTVAWLKELKQMEHPNAVFEIKQPDKYQKEGYYPLKYGFMYDHTPGEYVISLDELVFQSGTESGI